MAKKIISCPHCGAEYLPSELFLPDHFLGKPKNVAKDEDGKIIEILGKGNMDLTEYYRCDYCNKKFTVSASVNFKATSDSKNINSEYTTKLSKPGLFLDEE